MRRFRYTSFVIIIYIIIEWYNPIILVIVKYWRNVINERKTVWGWGLKIKCITLGSNNNLRRYNKLALPYTYNPYTNNMLRIRKYLSSDDRYRWWSRSNVFSGFSNSHKNLNTYTVGTGYKNIVGSKRICSYDRYQLDISKLKLIRKYNSRAACYAYCWIVVYVQYYDDEYLIVLLLYFT